MSVTYLLESVPDRPSTPGLAVAATSQEDG